MAESSLTKRALAGAMKTLMASRPFQKINVGDVCELCQMNRKSFYYHFRDKYDLVNWIFQMEFIAVMQEKKPDSYWEMVEQLCAYFYENRAFYRNALSVEGQNSFREYFQEVLAPVLQGLMDSEFAPNTPESDFLVTFYSDAFTAALIRWLSSRNCQKPGDFTAMLRLCVEATAQKLGGKET